MIVLGVGGIALAKGNFQSYGFTLKNWCSDLSIAIICIIVAAGYIPSQVFPVLAKTDALNAGLTPRIMPLA